jgi:RNA polymerase sigma-70 factor (ECF subfamily)
LAVHLMELAVTERGQDEELTALANQARDGSADAFDALARRVHDRVRRWAQGVTHDSDDADDVAQLVLLRLHSRLDQFAGRSRFTTWLYRLTRNVAFSRRAREARREELWTAHSRDSDALREPERGHGSAEVERLAALVRHYLTELPRRQRMVYELCDIRGLNSTEVAERLGVTASTVRGLLMKARRRIRLRILAGHAALVEDYLP